ncbi:unnamed protein product [Gadus morhua 'NCC']
MLASDKTCSLPIVYKNTPRPDLSPYSSPLSSSSCSHPSQPRYPSSGGHDGEVGGETFYHLGGNHATKSECSLYAPRQGKWSAALSNNAMSFYGFQSFQKFSPPNVPVWLLGV